MSGWLPFREEYPGVLTEVSRGTKILQVHGTADIVVRFAWGKSSYTLLESILTTAPQFIPIEGMGHSSHPKEMAAVDNFFKSIFNTGS